MDKRILSSQNIYCNKCGEYLFTERDVINSGVTTSVTERENDQKNYEYLELDDLFVCDECLKGNKS